MRKNQIFQILALGLAVVALLAIRIGSHVAIGDDAYMTFKNALNLMEGHEFSFNVGERVYATSTPLYAMLLALIGIISGYEPTQSFLPLNTVLDLANLFLLHRILSRSAGATAAAIGALLFAFSWNWAAASLIGMETPLFLFLLLATSYSVMSPAKHASKLGALCAGLSMITRPEGVILAGAFLLHLWRSGRQKPVKTFPLAEVLIVLIIGLAWATFSLNYFHVLLPHSIKAKNLGYRRVTGEAYGRIVGYLSGVFFLKEVPPRAVTAIIGGLLMVTWLLSATRTVLENRNTAVLQLFGLTVVIAYIVANPYVFNWYVVPLEPCYIVGIVTAASSIKFFRNGLAILALLLPLQFFVPGGKSGEKPRFELIQADCAPESFIPKCLDNSRDREDLYVKLASDLAPRINENTRILAPEFGAFGYYSKAYLISSLAHISPQVMKYLPEQNHECRLNSCVPLRMIKGEMPDYVFALDVFFAVDVLNDEWFRTHYTLTDSYPTSMWGSTALMVFKKAH